MHRFTTRLRRRTVQLAIAFVVVVSAAVIVAATASGKPAAHKSATAACGAIPTQPPNDKSGLIKTMPASVKAAYNGLTSANVITKSPWAAFKGVKKPWKIGLSMGLPLDSAPAVNWHNEFVKLFAIAKKKGWVTGNLMQAIAVNTSTYTPANQIADIQKMIRNGANGIFILPQSSAAIAPVVTAAGKKGVVMIPFIQTIPGSPYRVGHILAGAGGNVQPAAAAVKQIGGKGNAIIIRGVPGIPYETDAYNGIKGVLSQCPDVKLGGEVFGEWTVAKVKANTLNFLASHPEKIDAVLMVGDYAAGVIQAFEQVGRPVPVIAAGPANVGEIAWWGSHPDYCCIFGTAANSLQHAYAEWEIMTRILAGKRLKVSDIVTDVPLITKANYKRYIVPGATIDSVGEFPGADNSPAYAGSSSAYLDNFFVIKGNPFNIYGK